MSTQRDLECLLPEGECSVVPRARANAPPSVEMRHNPESRIQSAMTFYWVARRLGTHLTLTMTLIYVMDYSYGLGMHMSVGMQAYSTLC